MKALGWLLGLDQVLSIDQIDPSLAEPWAVEGRFWVFAGALALVLGSLVFYLKYQARGSRRWRAALGISRGLLLALLLVTLANPVLRVSLKHLQKPLVYLVFDGTDSMAIEDEYTPQQQEQLAAAIPAPDASAEAAPRSRAAYVQALLRRDKNNVFQRLQDEKQCRLEAFVFDGNQTSQLRKLKSSETSEERLDPQYIAQQLTTQGQVTALGAALYDVSQQFGAGNLAAMVMVSDFAHNSGVSPLGSRSNQEPSPANRLHVPIHTVGIGAVENVDLVVELQTDPKMKRAEKTTLLVKLRQSGLQDRTANVRVTARRMSGGTSDESQETALVGERVVPLTSSLQIAEFPFTPQEAGRFEFVAEVEPLEGEVVVENNRSSRDVNIIDDYLRLMYVAYEPTWEWRFVKEVFHRDKLVGMEGFRTYLASSDPQVRESNPLFLPTLTPKRSTFFANDVIFLDDMPRKAITDRFCDMLQEFVGGFGGGLVVICGPRFGPAEMHGTRLADMLPVIVDPDAKCADNREFRLRLTPHAARFPFMQLAENEVETAKAWDNLGKLAWYQPVSQLQEQGYALAEHPTDTCRDGKTPQPLIAIRQYGAGEVVYLGFNEMWRLRRMYGEKYYRTFWSQLIYRLGMGHALGADKRFVVRTDRQQYRAEDKVTLTIEAFDENFEPLDEQDLAQATLTAELTQPGPNGVADETRELAVPLLRQGVFESRIPVDVAGEYRIRVKDPVSSNYREVRFDVTGLSAERRSGVRNVRLQEDLATETHGKAYDLTTVDTLPDQLDVQAVAESYTRNYPLWSTPLWFIALVGLALGEWFFRKMIHLT